MLKEIFNNLAIKGLDKDLSDIDYVRGKMINTFILIFTISTFIFLFARLLQGEFRSAFVNVVLISQFLLAYYISIKKGHQLGAIYFLFIQLSFQVLLILSDYHISAFLHLSAVPIIFALLFNTFPKRNILFAITFSLIVLYYFYHDSHYNLILNYINIIGVSYFIVSQFIALTESNQIALNQALEEKQLIIEKLHKRNKDLEQFNYITSHDLQEPLQTITTYSNLLANNKNNQLDTVSVAGLDFMNKAANRMTSLIQDVFDYSRLGTLSTLGPVDLQKTIKAIEKEYQKELHEKKIRIICTPLPSVIGYEKELLILFQSLISNAIKFKKEEVLPVIEISNTKEKDLWKFTVKDNGIGIEEEDYESLFKLFYRLHAKGSYAGNGTGLAHCQKIVDLHNGKIWLESTKEEGSSFYFTISSKLNSAGL